MVNGRTGMSEAADKSTEQESKSEAMPQPRPQFTTDLFELYHPPKEVPQRVEKRCRDRIHRHFAPYTRIRVLKGSAAIAAVAIAAAALIALVWVMLLR
jgi:hypothetical protein